MRKPTMFAATTTIALGLLTPMLVTAADGSGPSYHSPDAPRASVPAKDERPGTWFFIDPDNLAPPVNEGDPEAPDFLNEPTLVDRPRGVMPKVPRGFRVEIFAEDFTQPRVLRRAPNGDIFMAESGTGRVLTFANPDRSRRHKHGHRQYRHQPPQPATEVFASGLDRPFGITFYPAKRPRWVYVGAADQVVRYPYRIGDRVARGPGQVIIDGIPTERHWTRDLAVAPDGRNLVISIGSASNVAGAMPEKTPAEISAWEATHGLGAAWAEEENRAVVRIFSPDGSFIRNYATGLRNCSGMTIQPRTGHLWCTGNERDHLGADVVPDYLTRVRRGGFYGWPWFYIGDHEDPAHAGERPDLAGKAIVPDVLIQAHSSTLQMVFYDRRAFGKRYAGDAFAALRGSWNRENRTGYKVVRAPMVKGRAVGAYQNFMTGFVLDEDRVWGRPTGLVVTQRGDLLVADDANGTLFRVWSVRSRHHHKHH